MKHQDKQDKKIIEEILLEFDKNQPKVFSFDKNEKYDYYLQDKDMQELVKLTIQKAKLLGRNEALKDLRLSCDLGFEQGVEKGRQERDKEVLEIIDKYVKSFCIKMNFPKTHPLYSDGSDCECVMHKLAKEIKQALKQNQRSENG
jgi:hypothetical protein